MSFHVGQLVVCVSNDWSGGFGDEAHPVRGRVYTIRELAWSNGYDRLHLRFLEIVNEPHFYFSEGMSEVAYNAAKFRPVEESRIEIFKRIAASPRKRIEVEA